MRTTNKANSSKTIFRSWCFFAIVASTVIAGGALWYYWHHLTWKYLEWKYALKNIEGVPSSPMCPVDIPEDWEEFSFSFMNCFFPPELSFRGKQPIANEPDYILLHDENTGIRISITRFQNTQHRTVDNEFSRLLSVPHPTEKTMTLTQRWLESLSVNANDFRWSMNRKEARWHIAMMTLRPEIDRYEHRKFIETFVHENWECTLEFFDEDWKVMYSSQCFSGSCLVSISFFADEESIEKLDLDIVRKIAQSINIDCSCSSLP